jgi:hypothetical protein
MNAMAPGQAMEMLDFGKILIAETRMAFSI